MKEKTFVSAVVYLYNAEKSIPEFLPGLDQALSDKFELYEIILVNDCSTDRTEEVVKNTAAEIKGTLTLLNLAWRHKREAAMLAGSDLALGDFVYEIESTRPDFSWNIIADLYDKSLDGFDVVYAFPRASARRKSKLFYWLLNRLSFLNVVQHTETVKIVSRKAMNRALLERGKVRYRKVLYRHCGFPTSSLFYDPIRKQTVTEEMTFIHKLSLASDVFVVFSNIGIHIAMLFSSISLLFSLFIGLYVIITYIVNKDVITGWTTTMLFLSISFSGLFLVLTILAKYISIILQEQRYGTLYTTKSIQKISTGNNQ